MRWRRHKRGDAAQPVVSDASYDQQLGEIVDELGLPLEPAFAYLDAVVAATSAIARAKRMLEPYARQP